MKAAALPLFTPCGGTPISLAMRGIPFIKMHGLGNDFVVIDARAKPLALDDKSAAAIAARHTGIGADQLIVIEQPHSAPAAAFMRIRNADGGGGAVRLFDDDE